MTPEEKAIRRLERQVARAEEESHLRFALMRLTMADHSKALWRYQRLRAKLERMQQADIKEGEDAAHNHPDH